MSSLCHLSSQFRVCFILDLCGYTSGNIKKEKRKKEEKGRERKRREKEEEAEGKASRKERGDPRIIFPKREKKREG